MNKEFTTYKLQLIPQIISKASELFAERGIRDVKMDMIAQSLGISKRTIYEIYATKEDLVCAVVKAQHAKSHEDLAAVASNSSNCMDVLIEVLRMELAVATACSPKFFRDLQRYPEAGRTLHSLHAQQHDRAMGFFKKGVEEGYFVSHVDYSLFSSIMEMNFDLVFSNERFSTLTYQQIFLGYICVMVRGFCTAKGLERIDAFISRNFPR